MENKSDLSYYIGYNSDGYQKLFINDGLTVTQVSNVNPNGNDNINQVFINKNESGSYKIFFSSCFYVCSIFAWNGESTKLAVDSFSSQIFSTPSGFVYLDQNNKKIFKLNPQDLTKEKIYESDQDWSINAATWEKILNHRIYFLVKNQKLVFFDGMTGELSEVTRYPTAFYNNGIQFDNGMSKLVQVIYDQTTNKSTPYLVNGNQLTNLLDNGETFSNLSYSYSYIGALFMIIQTNQGAYSLKRVSDDVIDNPLANKSAISTYRPTAYGVYINATENSIESCFYVTKASVDKKGDFNCSQLF